MPSPLQFAGIRGKFESLARAGLPNGIFSDQNRNLGKFWRVLQWKMLVYFMSFGLFSGHL
jgi:hypothetical protein